MAPASDPIACTLTGAERPAHERLLDELARSAVAADARPGVARIAFRGGPREQLEAFVAAEARCCPFLGLALDERADDVLLTVTAPADGQTVLDQLAARLAGGAPPPATPR